MAYDGPLPLVEKAGGTNQATYTTGDTLYASAANTLSKLAIGTAGQVMTVAGGVPSWAASGGGGGVVGFASTVSTTATSTATLVDTFTTPTTTNSVFVISITYTPTSSTSNLVFDFCCPYNGPMGVFLFQGTTLLNSYPMAPANGTAIFNFVKTSGTTSSTTYSVYYASNIALSNASLLGSYNGTESMTFSVTEIA